MGIVENYWNVCTIFYNFEDLISNQEKIYKSVEIKYAEWVRPITKLKVRSSVSENGLKPLNQPAPQ